MIWKKLGALLTKVETKGFKMARDVYFSVGPFAPNTRYHAGSFFVLSFRIYHARYSCEYGVYYLAYPLCPIHLYARKKEYLNL